MSKPDKHNGFCLQPVAVARTPYQQKFGIPRQAGLVELPGVIELLPPYDTPRAVDGLEQVSHIWLQFVFHQHLDRKPSLQVRPPRLGGNRKIGVFASRSSFRPNFLGQSVVRLDGIRHDKGSLLLDVSGLDVVDGTPIVDIKPYLPYADCVPDAVNQLADDKPHKTVTVNWQQSACRQLAQCNAAGHKHWISELIACDPRPAYKQGEQGGTYTMAVFGLDIRWQASGNEARVVDVKAIKSSAGAAGEPAGNAPTHS